MFLYGKYYFTVASLLSPFVVHFFPFNMFHSTICRGFYGSHVGVILMFPLIYKRIILNELSRVQQVMDSSLPCLLLFILNGLVTSSVDDNQRNGTRRYDYCVLGAGPAGLQMGYFLSKTKRDYIILERNSGPGSFFHK